jgi:NADH:ubiquinone oxidoreductase subunit F (NADH-binding)
VSSAPVETAWTTAPHGLPRLLAGADPLRAVGLDTHLARYGAAPRADAGLIDVVAESGLRGRGGGGFSTGRKLAAVASAGRRPVVVVNAVEGEPASSKDRMLVRHLPQLVLDGAVLAAEAVGAREAFVAVGGATEIEIRALESAIDARRRRRLDARVELHPVAVPRTFVGGEESALVQFLNGGPAKPTFGEKPFERGVLVQNAETIANLALIARFGAAWFREVGTTDEPGSVLVSLSGTVVRPGVYEIAPGTGLADVVRTAGGPSEPLRAVLVGGYFGSWLGRESLEVPLADGALAPYGARLGARALVVIPEGACGLVESARVARYLADESAGQCGPCVHGLDAIAGGLARLATGKGDARGDLRRWVDAVRGRGACRHPDGAASFAESALTTFSDEVDRHLRGRCSAGPRSVLPFPKRERG